MATWTRSSLADRRAGGGGLQARGPLQGAARGLDRVFRVGALRMAEDQGFTLGRSSGVSAMAREVAGKWRGKSRDPAGRCRAAVREERMLRRRSRQEEVPWLYREARGSSPPGWSSGASVTGSRAEASVTAHGLRADDHRPGCGERAVRADPADLPPRTASPSPERGPGSAVITLWASEPSPLFDGPQLSLGQTDAPPKSVRVVPGV